MFTLNRQYGLSKGSNEAMFLIEAYRTLRDRGPYPADQVVKDLDGSFAFVIYDSKAGKVFAALVIFNLLFVSQSHILSSSWVAYQPNHMDELRSNLKYVLIF